MKRDLIIFFIIIFYLFLNPNISSEITGDSITGESVTGEATSHDVSMSIFVSVPLPSLSIINPKNKTYLTNHSILLNYSVNNEDSVWYNIDNGENTTITSSIYFNTSQGGHILYLYANNTYGTTSRNVSFTTNSTKFIISYEGYTKGYKGSSTNFIEYPYENIQNLSNIILEHTIYGKILFNEPINLTDDSNSTDNTVDIDSNTNMSNNRIKVNSTELPNFNKQATIWIYNLAFSNPRILKDGTVCSSSTCTFENYIGGILKFNATGFSVYSAEETPDTETISPSSGGSTRKTSPKKEFEISTERIKVSLKQGETKKQTFKIKNIGKYKKKINISSENLDEFIKLSETEINLDGGESKTITIDFIAREDAKLDLYMGKILVKDEFIEEYIMIVIEVESKEALFDISMEIPKKFKYVMPGEEVSASISLYNLGELKEIDVNFEYIIKNDKGNIITSEKETLAIDKRLSFIKTLEIPENTDYGDYVFYVKVTYNEKTASASALFLVGEKPFFEKEIIPIIIGAITILIITILIIIYEIRKIKKVLKPKINERTLIKRGLIKKQFKKWI